MKRARIIGAVVAIVLLFALGGEATAMTLRMRANIGFSFIANDCELPAGEYWIEMVWIRRRQADRIHIGIEKRRRSCGAHAVRQRLQLQGRRPDCLSSIQSHRPLLLPVEGPLWKFGIQPGPKPIGKGAEAGLPQDWYGDYPELVKIAASLK